MALLHLPRDLASSSFQIRQLGQHKIRWQVNRTRIEWLRLKWRADDLVLRHDYLLFNCPQVANGNVSSPLLSLMECNQSRMSIA